MGSAEGAVFFLYRFSVVNETLFPKSLKYDTGHAQIIQRVFPGTLTLFSGVNSAFGLS